MSNNNRSSALFCLYLFCLFISLSAFLSTNKFLYASESRALYEAKKIREHLTAMEFNELQAAIIQAIKDGTELAPEREIALLKELLNQLDQVTALNLYKGRTYLRFFNTHLTNAVSNKGTIEKISIFSTLLERFQKKALLDTASIEKTHIDSSFSKKYEKLPLLNKKQAKLAMIKYADAIVAQILQLQRDLASIGSDPFLNSITDILILDSYSVIIDTLLNSVLQMHKINLKWSKKKKQFFGASLMLSAVLSGYLLIYNNIQAHEQPTLTDLLRVTSPMIVILYGVLGAIFMSEDGDYLAQKESKLAEWSSLNFWQRLFFRLQEEGFILPEGVSYTSDVDLKLAALQQLLSNLSGKSYCDVWLNPKKML